MRFREAKPDKRDQVVLEKGSERSTRLGQVASPPTEHC
jgi:hypothetical protein